MNHPWSRWSEVRDCLRLHGLTPGFAEALGARLDPAVAPAPPALAEEREIEALLNVRPDPLDIRDRYYEAPLIALPIRRGPADLATFGLSVRDQGAEGSCTGQALAAVIDMQNAHRRMMRDDRDKNLAIPTQVSARMLYENAQAYDEYPDDGLPGSSVRGAIKGFFHNGVCDGALAPYFIGDVGWEMTPEIGKAARATALGAYYRLRHILNDYHAALTDVEAILCSAMIHDGWTHEAVARANGAIRMAKKPTARKLLGAHAFAIVGYDSTGFYVLNSWGTGWGGCTARREGKDVPQPGIAHWSYEDWQNHVLDAWVLRLSAPFPNAFGMTGGFVRPQARSNVPTSFETREVTPPPPSTSRQQIIGHYTHLDDGRLVPSGRYPSSFASIKQTADYLAAMDDIPQQDDRYDHLVFYAHGGLNNLRAAASRTAAMTPTFKRNGVYPVFFMWRTGLAETLADIVRMMGRRIVEQAGGVEDLTNTLIETAAQRIGRPIWSDMKDDAARSFGQAPGEGWTAASILLSQLARRVLHPVKFHFIGHSAGAILLGHMIDEMRNADAKGDGPPLIDKIATVSLMAPACKLDFFERKLAALASADGAPANCATYILSDRLEQQDSFSGYGRSLLYLISNGLEGAREVPIAGMHRYWYGGGPGWTTVVADPKSKLSRATRHSGFDNDAATMNAILSRIRGRSLHERNGGFTAADLAWE